MYGGAVSSKGRGVHDDEMKSPSKMEMMMDFCGGQIASYNTICVESRWRPRAVVELATLPMIEWRYDKHVMSGRTNSCINFAVSR